VIHPCNNAAMKKSTKLPKRTTIKLTLNKETIRILPADQLREAAGGGHTTHCPTLALSCKPCHTC